jgi:hypothetical protein
VDQSAPWHLFRQQWMRLYPCILALEQQQEQPLHVPNTLLQHSCRGDSTSTTAAGLLTEIVTILRTVPHHEHEEEDEPAVFPRVESPTEVQAAETAAAIVLTGWDLRFKDSDDVDEHAVIECVFCLSRQPLVRPPASFSVEDLGDDDDASSLPLTKRRRTVVSSFSQWNAAHRYYCPWVCGFHHGSAGRSGAAGAGGAAETSVASRPLPRPLWQILADRLLATAPVVSHQQQQHNATEERQQPVTEIHRMLRAGVSSQRLTNLLLPPKGLTPK